jgi:hypothetical protein
MKKLLKVFIFLVLAFSRGNLIYGQQVLGICETQTTPLLLKKCASTEPGSIRPAELEETLDAINNQVADRFHSLHLFTVVESGELRTITGKSPEEIELGVPPRKFRQPVSYDLKDPKVAAHFKEAGIKYVLNLVLEDFSDQTLDLLRGQSSVGYVNQQQAGSASYNAQFNQRPGQRNVQANSAYDNNSSTQIGGTRMESNVRKDQVIRLSVRYRLLDAATGDLVDTKSQSFATNRIYAALAAGRNEKASGDLLQAAANIIADWEALNVGIAVNPIRVLDKADHQITINRGAETGVVSGQLYLVYLPGKQLIDPETKEVLGRKDQKVGTVSIEEIQPRFSTAKIISDEGITVGAILRPEISNKVH